MCAEVQAKSRSLGGYLASLEMRLTLKPVNAAARARITQLINHTNQFNLTSRRRTETELAALEGDLAYVTLRPR